MQLTRSFTYTRDCMKAWSLKTSTVTNLAFRNNRWLVKRCMSRSAEDYASFLASNSHPSPSSATFESLGIRPAVAKAFYTAFPNVKHPTDTQSKFIPAVLQGNDILLKDNTGCGKTFGLTMALLSKPRIRYTETETDRPMITSLVIVPHKDLAYQILHWIRRVVDASSATSLPSLSSIAQVLVRDKLSHVTTGLSSLRREPPHIVIGTPGALLDVFNEDPSALQLKSLSTVVVDEVDYLIDSVPRKHSKKMWEKEKRKLDRHPTVTKQLLDFIYEDRIRENERLRSEPEASQPAPLTKHSHSSQSLMPFLRSPQLIMSSATLRNHLRIYLYTESGWLRRENLQKVKGNNEPAAFLFERSQDSSEQLQNKPDAISEKYHNILGSNNLTHHVLVVNKDGSVKNIEGAVRKPTRDSSESSTGTGPDTLGLDNAPPAAEFASSLDSSLVEKYSSTPSPYNPDCLEVIATAFALDVPSVALLVLPSSASVHRAVFELCELGVNAHGLDLIAPDRGQAHLLQGASNVAKENPTLLVSTLATTRGLDLPELTHVFIYGVPEGPKVDGRTIDAYLHIAGRVGRFGRGGKIVTVVEGQDAAEEQRETINASTTRRKDSSDAGKMKRIFEEIWVTPYQLEPFD